MHVKNLISQAYALSLLAVLSVAVLATLHSVNAVQAQESDDSMVSNPDSNPYGASYQEWAARYWKWLVSIPSGENPIFDTAGKYCANGQSDNNVWFLAGPSQGVNSRECVIPEGKAIFMPVINVECDTATNDFLQTESEFTDCVKEPIDIVNEIQVSIDGKAISDFDNYRTRTSIFEPQLPEVNILGGSAGPIKMMADGYWLMLQPLAKGDHVIDIRAIQTDESTAEDEVNPSAPVMTTLTYKAKIGDASTPVSGNQNVNNSAGQNPGSTAGSNNNNPTPAPSNSKPSGCLIATAAFGSELTPQVQYLRNFRESYILSTNSGSAFMNVFNSVYYSFSPHVADYERQQPWLQQTVKTGIYPLFGILGITEKAFWAANGGEVGSILAGMTASVFIGAVYLSPVAAISKPLYRKFAFNKKSLIIIAVLVLSTALILGVASYLDNDYLLQISTSIFIVVLAGVSALVVSQLVWNLIDKARSKRRQSSDNS